MLTLRVSKRLYLEKYKKNELGKSAVIIASVDHANTIIRTINTGNSEYYPVAVINNSFKNRVINGIDIYSFDDFKKLEMGADIAIVDDTIDVKEIYEYLQDLSIHDIKIADEYNDHGAVLTNVEVEDLLARHPKGLDTSKIKEFIANKVVLVTGAGGSIGSEICRQCVKYGATSLILVEHSEYNLYAIDQELNSESGCSNLFVPEESGCSNLFVPEESGCSNLFVPKTKIVPKLVNVTNKAALEDVFDEYRPQIVIHAAAYKHVPMVEANIAQGIANNILGTKTSIDVAVKYGVEKFVLISTDKAVRPTNVMGTTKRICELYAQNKASLSKTEIVAVRFGNVLGSSGSVIPKFKEQIQKGGPITVTHPDITRYFMLIPEACELVLQAGSLGSGGEIFILDMGEPVKIVDLAKKLIELSGATNIEIKFSGLRPGEKLYEELLIDDSDASTEYEGITVAKPTVYDIDKLSVDIEELLNAKDDEERLVKLKEIVPEFDHKRHE
jgi:FlaA1/EpsC-like NDP-sugar epimerase